jgi:hypothetical protein
VFFAVLNRTGKLTNQGCPSQLPRGWSHAIYGLLETWVAGGKGLEMEKIMSRFFIALFSFSSHWEQRDGE